MFPFYCLTSPEGLVLIRDFLFHWEETSSVTQAKFLHSSNNMEKIRGYTNEMQSVLMFINQETAIKTTPPEKLKTAEW